MYMCIHLYVYTNVFVLVYTWCVCSVGALEAAAKNTAHDVDDLSLMHTSTAQAWEERKTHTQFKTKLTIIRESSTSLSLYLVLSLSFSFSLSLSLPPTPPLSPFLDHAGNHQWGTWQYPRNSDLQCCWGKGRGRGGAESTVEVIGEKPEMKEEKEEEAKHEHNAFEKR